ncbi:pentatricopeptide repeat-containing protein At4g02750-like [Macadamia integrifolia]|uniref:pentatricopeptide repeat-containing protein At4g02750-like n=1 Tax=Macadamia integrifolia TaxID=60698 RepID=UPI001C4F845E|nr:pentatricopeptide repeat-containing protein At4g02750-like [Macadamia integrifolia]
MFFFFRSTVSLKHGRTLISPLVRKNSLARLSSIREGNWVSLDTKPLNTQITHYMRNGYVKEAQKLFDEMPHRNTVTWNSMIRGYFKNGNFHKALLLFDQMPSRDLFSYNTMIAGLMQYGDTNGAEKVFVQMTVRDVVTWNSMIAGYIRNSLMDDALMLFNQMPSRNVISWNLVMAGLVNLQAIALAEQLFKEMPTRDVASWTIMISGLASAGRMVEARELFEDMPVRDVKVWNTMMVGYIGNGNVEIAEGLFQKMPEQDSDSWNELLNGLVGCQRINDAVRLFTDMPHKGPRSWNSILLGLIRSGLVEEAHGFLEKNPFNDAVSWTNVIIGYFELGDVGTAIKLFELMPDRDETAWNATIFELGENDHGEIGLKYFVKMKQRGPPPDEATFTSILTISSDLPSLDFGKQSHAQIIKTGYNSFIAVSNAVVTMYARCGGMRSALLEFSSMPIHDVISWNSIICGFAHNGNGMKALKMFKQMRSTDVKPDQITFVGVLSACSHAGLIDHGGYYFNFMRYKCFLQPTCEHYTCMVDLLGRFGLIDDAVSFIDQMKADGVEVSSSVWGALLGACRIHKNVKVGEIAAENILAIELCNAGVYLILAEIYLNCEMREDAERIWTRMKGRGVKKQPGCSWIEVNNVVHIFLAGDCSHPEFSSVCCVLDLLKTEMENEFQ